MLGNSSGARAADDVARTLSERINAVLWQPGGDHYVTQRNLDNSTLDMVPASAARPPSALHSSQMVRRP